MSQLNQKVQNALDEGRILILGAQVLIGFQFRSTFEPGFDKLSASHQYLKMGALWLMLVVFALLIWPAAYHRIIAKGEDTEELHRFATRVIGAALLPFALALGIDLYATTRRFLGPPSGLLLGIAVSLAALFFWYGFEFIARARRAPEKEKQSMKHKDDKPGRTKLEEKIRHVLTETRMVLPGAQALLGFQFAIILLESFDKLPASLKYLHLTSLVLVALSTILLIMPAAYHRIVEKGEETEQLHRLASWTVLAAMVVLALGICGDFFVVVSKVTGSLPLSISTTLGMLALFCTLWFGFTLWRRKRHQK